MNGNDLIKSDADDIKKYYSVLKFYANRYKNAICDFDDLMQEGYLALFKAKESYEESKNASFETYLSVVVRNRMLNLLRKESKKDIPGMFMPEKGSEKPVESGIIDDEEYINLKREIKLTLSNFEFTVLNEFLKKKSYREIAETLGKNEKSIDNALKRIRKKIGGKII